MFYTAAVLGGLKHKHLETSSLFETHVFLAFLLSFFPLDTINDVMHFLYCMHLSKGLTLYIYDLYSGYTLIVSIHSNKYLTPIKS